MERPSDEVLKEAIRVLLPEDEDVDALQGIEEWQRDYLKKVKNWVFPD